MPNNTRDPLSASAWAGRIKACKNTRKDLFRTWQDNVAYRRGKPFKTAPPEDTVNVPADWSRTKNKQAQLWYQLPEVKLDPTRDQWRSVAPVFAAALNFELKQRIRAEHTMNECLGDVINASGIAIAKVGYEATFAEVEVPGLDQTQYDPQLWAQMEAAGQIPMVPTQQTIYEAFYANRISPAHFLWPVEFVQSDWQKAHWLGWEGYTPLAEAQRQEWVDDAFEGGPIEDEEWLLIKESNDQQTSDGWVKFTELFYRPAAYDPQEKDWLKIKRAVLVDGREGEKQLVVDEDFQWQRYDQASRSWVGMTSFPIKAMTIAKISDLAIPPSDSEMGRPQVKELIKLRSLYIKQQEHSMPLRWFDVNQVDDEIADLMRKGKWQGMVPMNGPGDHAIGEVARASFPKEDFDFDRIARQDLDEAWSMGNPQMSTPSPGDTTATEIKQMTTSLNVRMEFERGWVLGFFLEIAQGVGHLMQLFADDLDYAKIVGEDGVQTLKAWNKDTIQGEFVFTIKPDSQLKLDAGQKRVEALNMYKLLRQDPLINPVGLVSEVLEQHGLDPSKVLAPPQPPKPEKPSVSYAFKGEDLVSPFVIALIQKTDTPITPADIAKAKALLADMAGMLPPQPPQPALPTPLPTGQTAEHGGPSESVQPLNKRYEMGGNSSGVEGKRDSNIPTP